MDLAQRVGVKDKEIAGDHVGRVEYEFPVTLVCKCIVLPNLIGVIAGLIVPFRTYVWWSILQEHPSPVCLVSSLNRGCKVVFGNLYLVFVLFPGFFRVNRITSLPESQEILLKCGKVCFLQVSFQEVFFQCG